MKLLEIWAKEDLDLEQFAKKLGISRSTVTRIMAAERSGEKHPVSLRMAGKLTKTLSKLLDSTVDLKDLEGVELAPPRPGRPKKKQENQ